MDVNLSNGLLAPSDVPAPFSIPSSHQDGLDEKAASSVSGTAHDMTTVPMDIDDVGSEIGPGFGQASASHFSEDVVMNDVNDELSRRDSPSAATSRLSQNDPSASPRPKRRGPKVHNALKKLDISSDVGLKRGMVSFSINLSHRKSQSLVASGLSDMSCILYIFRSSCSLRIDI